MRLIDLVFYTWCLPQTLLGHIILLFSKRLRKEEYKLATVHRIENNFGISAGKHIILSASAYGQKDVRHEYGHVLQNLILGPLYLFVIGIPSITMNIMSRFSYLYGKGIFAENYYNRWPESWADKLGKVYR